MRPLTSYAHSARFWVRPASERRHAASRELVNEYLTLLGGGAFGNQREWILDAIRRSLDKVRGQALDVCLVSYGHVPTHLQTIAAEFQ